MEPLLYVHQLTKSFGDQPVLHGLSLEVQSGEVVVLVGESGAGKSTLLHLLAGLTEPDGGEIRLGEADVAAFARRLVPGHPEIKLVPQDYRLFPNISLRENVAYALREYTPDYRKYRVDFLLERCGLLAIAGRRPREASGGEQQRTAIARALAERPRLLLLDEPFSHLDALNRQILRETILQLVREEGVGCVLVTHDLLDALTTADRLGVMRQGRLLQMATPGELLRGSVDPYVKALIDSGLLLVKSINALLAPVNEPGGLNEI